MKPLVFYDFEPAVNDPNNSVTIKKHRLEEILQEVYNAGVEDGKNYKQSLPSWTPGNLRTPISVETGPYTRSCAVLDDVNMTDKAIKKEG